MNRKPTFLYIGPDKSGSSWLYSILDQHPDCYVPKVKDIYFFDRYYHRGLDWYFAHFKHAPEDVHVLGELSHDYLYSKLAAERIHRDLKNVKLMTILRDPVKRSFSHYLFLIRSGLIREKTFEESLQDFPELIDNSLYYKHLSSYFEIFPKDQIGVFLFDNLNKDPDSFARDVFIFLGLCFIDSINYSQKVLPAAKPNSYMLARLVRSGSEFARRLGLENMVGRIKTSPIMNLFYTPYSQGEKPSLNDTQEKMLFKHFIKDIDNLENLLDLNLAEWKKRSSPDEANSDCT